MVPYALTPAAEADVREMARDTLRQWGVRQQRRYGRPREACCRGMAAGRLRARDLSARYPQVRVTRCPYHDGCSLHPEGQQPRLCAVLHARMDLLASMGARRARPGSWGAP